MRDLYQNKKSLCFFFLRFLLIPLLIIGSCSISTAQCPPNIDFEDGSFFGWECWVGNTSVGPGNVNQINLSLVPGPVAGRHTMLSSVPGNGIDQYGGFPVNCPNGSGHSIKLGNNIGGGQAEGVSYTFTIPPTQDQFSLIYHYAVVFQDPGHPKYQQPRMVIEIKDLTGGGTLGCSSFAFEATGGLPGFFPSPNPGGTIPVWCKDWSAATIDLNGYAGRTIQLFFKTADCTLSAHFGYGYVDVNTQCASSFVGATFCSDDTAVNVTAPFGYQAYRWFNIFNTTLGTNQTLHLQPPPLSGDSVFVELTPYSGYGCLDTLTAHLWDTLTIQPYAGRDTSFCNSSGSNSVQLGAPPVLGLIYSWSPPTGLSNPNISNPIASPLVSTQYELSVKNNGGGCLAKDTVNVNIVNLDTTLLVTGPTDYCAASGQSVSLHVNLPADSVQWYFNGGPIPGATLPDYAVTQSGDYYATLFSFVGCSFNTRVQHINIYTSPVASFNTSATDACYDGNVFSFSNTSSPPSGTPQYLWTFGDGNSSTNANATHSYAAVGTYTVWMYISGDGGCIDSAQVTVNVHPSTRAGFKINDDTQCYKSHSFIFTDTSSATPGATLGYLWNFGDGNTSNQHNVTHAYLTPGTYSVSLKTDAGGGCTDQVSYNVTVFPTPVANFGINTLNQCYKGNQYIITDNSSIYSGTMQYTWDFGDGTTSSLQSPTYSYAKAGGYNIKLLLTTPDGCADSMSKAVTVYPNPKAEFSVQPSICINLQVPVGNQTINNTTSTLVFAWDFGNGVTSAATSPIYSYPNPGTYTIRLLASSVQCPFPPDTATHSILVDAPVPGVTYPVIDAVILWPEPLKARSIGTTALWNPPTNLDNRKSYTPKFTGQYPQLYNIQLKTPSGCITTDTQYVKVHKKIEIYVPTVFMPGGANNYLRPLCMGIAKVNYFRIFDRWGKLLFQMASDVPGWNGKINNVQQELQTVVWMIEAIDVDGNMHHRQGTTVLLH